MNIKLLFTVIYEFFKTGLFAVGGGLATIPFLQDMAGKYGWFDLSTLSTMIAVSESTPGPIGVNMATYVGYIALGPLGGIISTLALVCPSIIVILIIANMFEKFKESKIVKQVFNGIRPFVVGLIIAACLDLFLTTLLNLELGFGLQMFSILSIVIFIVLLFIYNKFKINPILIIVIGAIIGIVIKL